MVNGQEKHAMPFKHWLLKGEERPGRKSLSDDGRSGFEALAFILTFSDNH